MIGYRNKVEFSIGKEINEGKLCVGFTKGNLSKGLMTVDYPDNIKAISKESLIVAKMVEKFL